MAKRIAIYLVGRTLPGLGEMGRAISEEFGARISMRFMEQPLSRAYHPTRKQYDAEALLEELARFALTDADHQLFLIKDDMYDSTFNFVFGLELRGSCIVSVHRLDPRFYGAVEEGRRKEANTLFKERIQKEIIHELGHAYGLPHCPDRDCVMVFSESIEGVDHKGRDFCQVCRKAIKI